MQLSAAVDSSVPVVRSGAGWRAVLSDALTDPQTTAFRRTARVLLALIMLSIGLIAADANPAIQERFGEQLHALELLVMVAFSFEYVANVLVARPWRTYVLGWWGIIDLLAILPFYATLLPLDQLTGAAGAAAGAGINLLRELRVLRVLRMLKLLKVARAARADADDIWLPLAIFVSVAATGWVVDDIVHRTETFIALGGAGEITSIAAQLCTWAAGAYLANRLIHVLVWDGLLARNLAVPVPRLIRDVTSAAIYLVTAVSVSSSVFRLPLTGVWATTGAFTVVIGLALRNVILDLFMGLASQFDRPFNIGDYVILQPNGVVGRVVEVHWRTTRIETSENNTVIVPNSRIGEMLVTNLSVPDARTEFELLFTLEHRVPADRVLEVLTGAALTVAGDGGILADPEPKARLRGTSGLGIEYKVKYWIDCTQVGPGKARHRVLAAVLAALQREGIALARAQDVHYNGTPSADLAPIRTAPPVTSERRRRIGRPRLRSGKRSPVRAAV